MAPTGLNPRFPPMSKAARWLDLVAFLLQYRFPVTREQIFEAVDGYGPEGAHARQPAEWDATQKESARRKFERDKDELRALGVDIETRGLADAAGDEPATGYRLRAEGLYLPYLQIDERPVEHRPYPSLRSIALSREELGLLDRATHRLAQHPSRALQSAAGSVRRKLAFDVPLTVHGIERLLGESGRDEPNDTLEVLQQAVARRHRVECRYYSIGRDAHQQRTLEPYGLFFNWGHWYCVASDQGADAPKVFRLDRISGARLARGKDAAHAGPPEGFELARYLGRSAWDLSDAPPVRAVVRFRFPEARWVVAQGVGNVREPYTDDGGAVIEFEVRDADPFLRWLLTFRDHAEVEDPTELGHQLADLRRRVAQLYAADA